MTMAYHIYDPIYCKVMMIAICDMQFEDMELNACYGRRWMQLLKKKGWVHGEGAIHELNNSLSFYHFCVQ
jgi:hypothetical protein